MSLVNFNNKLINLTSTINLNGAGNEFTSLINFTLEKGLYFINCYSFNTDILTNQDFQILNYGLSLENDGFNNTSNIITFNGFFINLNTVNKFDVINIDNTTTFFLNLFSNEIDPKIINTTVNIKKIY